MFVKTVAMFSNDGTMTVLMDSAPVVTLFIIICFC